MSTMYRQGRADIDLFVERNTHRTPEGDHRYFIFHEGRQVAVYRREGEAMAEYKRIRDALAPRADTPAQIDRAEALTNEAQEDRLLRAEVYWATSSRYRSR